MVNKISKIIIIVIAIITFLRVSCRSPAETKYQFKDDKLRSSREENSFRDYIKTNLNNRLDPKISGLAVAYLVGDKNGLSSSLKEKISEIGLTHLIVISGMHLVVLVKILSDGLKPMSRLVKKLFLWSFCSVIYYDDWTYSITNASSNCGLLSNFCKLLWEKT